MSKLIPKAIPAEMWKQLTPNKTYGIRANSDDDIHLRFGPGGVYVSILNSPPAGRIVNSVSIEDGTLSVIGKINAGELTVMGRATETGIKVVHPIMSRSHVEIKLDGNVLTVKDLGSTNGTFFYSDNIVFDIDDYLSRHPVGEAATSTMDELHESFGSSFNDFLKRYSESKKSNS